MALDRKRIDTLREGFASHVQSQAKAGNYRPNEVQAAIKELHDNFDEHVLGIPRRPADAPDADNPPPVKEPAVIHNPANDPPPTPEELAAVRQLRQQRDTDKK